MTCSTRSFEPSMRFSPYDAEGTIQIGRTVEDLAVKDGVLYVFPVNLNVPRLILRLTPKSIIRLDPIDEDRIVVKIEEQTFGFSPTMPIHDNREKWLSVIQNQIENLRCVKRPTRETDKQQVEKIEKAIKKF